MSDLKKSIDRDGYAVVPGVLSLETIERARAAVLRMRDKVVLGQYGFFQMDKDFLGFNVTGIDQIFNPAIFEEDILAAAVESKVLSYASEVLGLQEPAMLLSRIHMNEGYPLNGFWHRDADPWEPASLQAAIYLYPESGLLVLPGSHDQLTDRLIANGQDHLPSERYVGGLAGDLLLFRSSILHRGTCKSKRAHIFFRIGERAKPKEFKGSDGDWSDLLRDPSRNCDFFPPSAPAKRQPIWRRILNEFSRKLRRK